MSTKIEDFKVQYDLQREKATTFIPQEFGIQKFKSLQMSDGLAFKADVTYNKKVVGYVENGGTGGPDLIRFMDKTVQKMWETALDEYFGTTTGDSKFLAEEMLIDALLTREGF